MEKELEEIKAIQRKILDKLTVISFWQEYILKWIAKQEESRPVELDGPPVDEIPNDSNMSQCERYIRECYDRITDEFVNDIIDHMQSGSNITLTTPILTTDVSTDSDTLMFVDWRTLEENGAQFDSWDIVPNATYGIYGFRETEPWTYETQWINLGWRIEVPDILMAPTVTRFHELYDIYQQDHDRDECVTRSDLLSQRSSSQVSTT